MKQFVRLSLLTALFGSWSAVAQAQNVRVYFVGDPHGRNLVTVTSQAQLETTVGRDSAIGGEVELNPDALLSAPRASFDVDLGALDTGVADLDQWLRGPDGLDVAKYPKATFTLTRIVPSMAAGMQPLQDGVMQSLAVLGQLEIRGVTKAVRFQVEITPVAQTHDTQTRMPGNLLHLRTSTTIKLADYGITVPAGASQFLADQVDVSIDLLATNDVSNSKPAHPAQ